MRKKIILAAGLIAGTAFILPAQEMKKDGGETTLASKKEEIKADMKEEDEKGKQIIRIVEDRDQKFMSSKVYELKNAKATDIAPFVLGAVKRFNSESNVNRLSYAEGMKEFLAVNTGTDMIPLIDDMVSKLDRPGKEDGNGSTVEGTGIKKFVYKPRFRASSEMAMIGPTLTGGDGAFFFDQGTNMFYWKDVESNGKIIQDWFRTLDRPTPQMQITLNVYEVSTNDMKELGIDYVAWKNGPGADIFSGAFDFLSSSYTSNSSTLANPMNIAGSASHSWGGFMVAPQFDATFIRMLAQKGNAKIATSGTLTVVNDFIGEDPGLNNFDGAKYKIKFMPGYQNIQKDEDQNVSVNISDAIFYFYVRRPVINFNGYENPEKAATMEFGWVMNITDTVEKLNNGMPVQNTSNFNSWTTLAAASEKIIAVYNKEHKVNQDNGMPFLSDIPYLKYLFGAVNNSEGSSKIFVTVKADPVNPDALLSEWSGRILTASEYLNKNKAADEKNAKQ